MDDSTGTWILIFISVGVGILILAAILSVLELDFGNSGHSVIFIGELIAIGILLIGILKIKSELAW